MSTILADDEVAARDRNRRQYSLGALGGRALIYLGGGAFLGFSLFPFYVLVTSALKSESEIMGGAVGLSFVPTLENFRNVLFVYGDGGVARYLFNSIAVTAASTALATLLGAMCAYGLSRYRFRFNRDLSFFILSTRFAPAVAFIIPLYVISRGLGLLDTHLVLVLIYTSMNLSLVVWIMDGFFRGVPVELEESARVDGYTRWEIFWTVVLPLVRPGLAVSAILSAIFAWNEFIFALMLTQREATTIPVYLSLFVGAERLSWGPFMAVGVLSVLPVVAASMVIQRYMTRGLSFAAVK